MQQTDVQHKRKVKGIASKSQCVSVLQTCSSDVRELIAAVDRKGTGYISYDDFEAVMARSLLQHTQPVEAAVDLSATIRLQPDSSALPFHEVPIALSKTLDLLLPISFSFLVMLYYLHVRHHLHAASYLFSSQLCFLGIISLHCEAHLMVAVCICLCSRCCWTAMQPPMFRWM